MKVIIAGAGDVGFHLAKLLAYEEHEIILIDLNEGKLKHAAKQLDVITIKGSATSFSVLEKAEVKRPIFLSQLPNPKRPIFQQQ